MKEFLRVMWHCLINIFDEKDHSPIESWNSLDSDFLPIKYNYKIWCECGFNKGEGE